MTPQQLEAILNSDVKAALAFLNTIVASSRSQSIIEIEQRPDVQEAIRVIHDFLDDVLRLTQTLPDSMQADRMAVLKTVSRMREDMQDRIWTDPRATNTFWTRLVWLMAWLIWPFLLLDAIASKRFTKKTWISRLSDNTCTYCRRLHGVTIPIDASFAPAAIAIGWTRIYGSLMVPPLHPSCGCVVVYS